MNPSPVMLGQEPPHLSDDNEEVVEGASQSQWTPDQKASTRSFLSVVNHLRHEQNLAPLPWNTAVKFLMARKFDINRAVSLYEQHENTRIREGLWKFDPNRDPLRTELDTGKFTILPARDAQGAAIAVFTARLHYPQRISHRTTLQGVVYQLDVAMESMDTQRCGLVFIYDMTESKYGNFDYELSQKILTLLKGAYPARLKKVLIVTAPLWFKAPFKFLRLFVREKLRDRVYTITLPQLPVYIPADSLPVSLGGRSTVDHASWLLQCRKSLTNRHGDYLVSMDNNTTDHHKQDQDEKEVGSLSSTPTPEDEEVSSSFHNNPPVAPPSPSLPLSSASSGFSDDDSLHFTDTGNGCNIEDFIQRMKIKGRKGLYMDYLAIKGKPPDGTFNNSRLKGNLTKNRYTDVLCYDHTRVLLSQIEGDPCSDYINANYVDGYKQKNAFISTQGPLPKTFGDFWRMVWEQHVLVVVMTTRVMERGRCKCGQYWPVEEGGEMQYDHFKIISTDIQPNSDYTITRIKLENTQTSESREISHMQFTSWPDYGVPTSALAMIDFLLQIREQQALLVSALGDTWAGHPLGPPIIVHCSAGIGRTGTLCTLDICIRRLRDVGSVDVEGTVERIRSQRAYSIQMPDQYIFCHLALIEYALKNGLVETVDLTGFDEDGENSDSE